MHAVDSLVDDLAPRCFNPLQFILIVRLVILRDVSRSSRATDRDPGISAVGHNEMGLCDDARTGSAAAKVLAVFYLWELLDRDTRSAPNQGDIKSEQS